MLTVLMFLNRLQQHALRAADGPDGVQAPFPNPVVNRPARNAEKLSSLIDRDAPPELGLEHVVVNFNYCRVHGPPTSAVLNGRGGATPS